MKWIAQAANKGHPEAQRVFITIIEAMAEHGIAESQFLLAMIYGNGEGGISKDPSKAAEWTRKSAEQGHVTAQYMLGNLYYTGQGVPQDYEEAEKWTRRSANKGHPDAQFLLGGMYVNGLGVEQSYQKAFVWHQKAAKQGHSQAQYLLGLSYYSGEGTLQNHKEAYAWLNVSAAQGLEDASEARKIVAAQLSPEALSNAQELSQEYYKKYVEAFQ